MEISDAILKAFGMIREGEIIYHSIWATNVHFISPNLGVREIIDHNGERELALVVSKKTGGKEIINNWSLIESAIDKIEHEQGFAITPYLGEILRIRQDNDFSYKYEFDKSPDKPEILLTPRKKKPSYYDLAIDANFDALVFMYSIYKAEKGNAIQKLGPHFLRGLLEIFNIRNVDEIIKDASMSLSAGKCPWNIQSYPINKTKMREKIRYLEEIGENNKYFISRDNSALIYSIYRFFLTHGYWQGAEEILKNTFDEVYQHYQDRLNARTNEILYSSSSFPN